MEEEMEAELIINLEKMIDDYDNFSAKTKNINSVDDFLRMLETKIKGIKQQKRKVKKEQRVLERSATKLFCLKMFTKNPKIEKKYDDYIKEYVVLFSHWCFLDEYNTIYRSMQKIVNEDNYLELTKLVDFSEKYNCSQALFYYIKRARIQSGVLGEYLFDNLDDLDDNYNEIISFLIFAVDELSNKNIPQYVKVMNV